MDSNQAAAQKAYILNALALLAVVIPVGAVADQLTSASQIARGLFLFIFSFHMPLLFLLGGALFRRIAGDCGKVWRTVGFLLLVYALMKLLTAIVQQVPFDDGFAISWLKESGMPWVFLGAAFCCVLGWLLRKADGWFVLPAAVVLALACGYTSKVGDFLALSRVVVYFPYFAAGQLLDMDKLEAALREKKARVAGLAVLAAAFLGMMLLADKLYFLRALLTGRNSYGALNERQAWGPVLRIGVYCLGVVLSASVLAVVPRRELGKFVNNLGGRFAQIYFWYRPLLHALTGLGLLKTLEGAVGIAAGRIVWMLLAPACVAALSCRAFRWPLSRACKAVDAVGRWIENRPRSIGELRQRYGVRALDAKYYDLLSASSGKKRFKVYLVHYTLAFAVAALLVYSPFIIENKTMVWGTDGRMINLPFLAYTGQAIRRAVQGLLNGEFAIPQFDICIGMGEDIIGPANPIGAHDPLVLLIGLVPVKYTEYFSTFINIFRIYLAGLSFSCFCFYFQKTMGTTLIGSLVYSLSGFAVLYGGVEQPFWATMMIQFPLLILGFEKILRNEKPWVFVFAVFYASACEYYHMYMQSISLAIYGLVRFFDLYKENRVKQFIRVIGRAIGFYLLGVGLSGAALIPSIAVFLGAARNGFSNPDAVQDTSTLLTRVVRFIAPPGSTINFAFAAIALFALVLLFFSKKRRTLKILAVVAIFMLISKKAGLAMTGFQFVSWRFSFVTILLFAYITVEMMPEMFNMSRKQRIICICVLCAYAITVFISAKTRQIKYGLIGVSFLALTLLVLSMDLGHSEKRHIQNGSVRTIICLILVIVNVGINGIYLFSPDQYNFISQFYLPFGGEGERLENAIEREIEPYLLENPQGRFDSSSASTQYSMVWGLPHMQFYNSVVNGNTAEFWNEVEVAERTMITKLDRTSQRTEVNTLVSTKYQVESPSRVSYVPFGYRLIETTEKGNLIYENEYALPWGYTYDTDDVISYEDLEGLDGIAKAEVMLQKVAFEDTPAKGLGDVVFDEEKLSYREIQYNNCTWEDGVLVVSSANASMKVLFDLPASVEGYARLVGFDINGSGVSNFFPKISCGAFSSSTKAMSDEYPYYFGREDYLFNLGYSDQERHELTITFPVKGTFKLADIELYALPMDNYPAHVEALRAEPMENIQWGTNSLTGTVDLSKDKILCVSVPYSKGWTATVDGEEAEILRGNYMFMCIPLTAGHHDIAFHYSSPGLKLGTALTVCSAAIAAVMLLRDRKKKGAASQLVEKTE